MILAMADTATVFLVGLSGLIALVVFVLWIHPSTPWGWSL